MPAFVQREERIAVVLWHGGVQTDRRTAASGGEAVLVAMRMLSGIEALEVGDRLEVVETSHSVGVPAVAPAARYP